jgi:hypothetical protein
MQAEGVVEATYLLDTSTTYEAPPLDFQAASIQFKLADYTLRAWRGVPWPTIASARHDVEAVFRSWRLQSQLTHGMADFTLRFQGVEIVGSVQDEAAHPSEPPTQRKNDKGPLIISLREYPAPPQILATPELEAAADRFHRACMEFGEPVESAAYFALTLAESQAGGRRPASARFGLDTDVLSRIGMLTSTRGSLRTARKAIVSTPVPLSPSESRWLRLATRTLLLHMGLVNAGLTPPIVRMQDLPR